MGRKIFALAVVIVLIISIMPERLEAYTAANYYKNQIVKVGLKDMQSSTIVVTFNGDYSSSDKTFKNGTSLTITIQNGQLLFDGILYNELVLTPQDSNAYITLKTGTSKIRNYKGDFRFILSSSSILPINSLNIEEYLKGVVGYEMSDYFALEALKAQAVTARSYALYRIGKYGTDYDLTDTTDCQVYNGFDNSFKNVINAVDATRGQIITYNGALVEALYSANHGGYTEAAENVWGNAFPYYISKKDDYDDYIKYANSKSYDFTRNLTSQQIQNLLNTSLGNTSNKFIKINLDTISTYISGRISNLELLYTDANGVQNKKVLSKTGTRTFFGFPSSMYTVTYNSSTDTYTFVGHGAGHGLGMSQIGALNRALAGQTYKDILTFYYDKTYIYNCLASINSVTQNLSSAFTGEALNFQAQAVNGSGLGYLYKYTVEKAGEILYTSDYSSDSRLSYTTDSIGDYTVSLYLKDSQSKSEYDDKRVLSFKVTGFGDVNLDGNVDVFDLVSVSKNINKTKDTSANWNPNADINRDNILDINDLAAVARNYNIKY